MQSERSPLLGPESPFCPPDPGASALAPPPPPPYVEIETIDTVGTSADFVRCDVCSYHITKSSAQKKRVITCPRCNETTALREPEKGKRFLRCPECNCLMSFNKSSHKTICPRDTCKTTIDVKTGKPVKNRNRASSNTASESINAEPQYRITCGHCRSSFQQTALSTGKLRCPICRKKSRLGEGSGRRAAVPYIGLGLVCIVLCLALMALTLGLRHNAGYWYIYLLLLIMAVGLISYGLWCLCMRQSSVEVTTQNV
ncbi:transmembrane protein 55A-like [Tropilaelaps mercedesae]|uniref:Phosphatidylinositol-4,5-bisphosphate 4-phosphatase n=1 Tax=Tropilaelaps mercedesae TaxID=418985 RepID=A0A1V9XTF3_9ACAR|nr:transmembrane protein 55A-like [Tropilaelaps mercedesae]